MLLYKVRLVLGCPEATSWFAFLRRWWLSCLACWGFPSIFYINNACACQQIALHGSNFRDASKDGVQLEMRSKV